MVIDCSNLDEAIAIASGHPYSQWGGVEIRPVWE
ncbi:MAG: YciI family protein [Mycobacteriales bacterium]